ncbi:hypothetical protein ABK040_008876 [Willaertia magna]
MRKLIGSVLLFITLFVLCFSNNHVLSQRAIFIGGNLHEDNTLMFNKLYQFLTIKGKSNNYNLGIVTAASEDPLDSANYYTDLFSSYFPNTSMYWIPIDEQHIGNNSNPEVLAKIDRMDLIFFGGGDQSRLINCFFMTDKSGNRIDSPALSLIRKNYLAKKLAIAGTSAGTAIQCGKPAMITGGVSYEAIINGAFNYSNGDNLSFDNKGGFGFFPIGVLDTHFSERGRQGRIIRLASFVNERYAFGIDENTALIQNDFTSYEVMGTTGGGVFIFDLLKSSTTGTNNKNWGIKNVSVTYLTNGDRMSVSIRNGKTELSIEPSKLKRNIRGLEDHKEPLPYSHDIFSSPENNDRENPREFPKIACDLFNSYASNTTKGFTFETSPVVEVLFDKSEGIGFKGLLMSSSSTTLISFVGMKVSIGINATRGF